ncbi:hypothetical protein ANN_22318 [Periplaneta americana]|uniref:Uncharacterized protein n=1 Tax=Periplaneta americana TaxID=6978 RepID=A0ABQ8S7T9_PERAM|nr:hypothetical protein ANN_22318 [Periplaneta americana]
MFRLIDIRTIDALPYLTMAYVENLHLHFISERKKERSIIPIQPMAEISFHVCNEVRRSEAFYRTQLEDTLSAMFTSPVRYYGMKYRALSASKITKFRALKNYDILKENTSGIKKSHTFFVLSKDVDFWNVTGLHSSHNGSVNVGLWNKLRRGKGVEMYSEVTAANSWIANKKGLSTSEWISSLKMTANLAAVRSVPGRSFNGTRYRHGCSETETLAHVLGFYEQGLLLRNSRHHLIRSKIVAALRNKGWIVEEEISCITQNGSTRRVYILAYNADTKQGIIVDPTVRFEVECHQSAEVHLEKKSIYEPTVNYFKLKYALIHVEVFGLLIGARGTIPAFFEEFRRQFTLPISLRDDIVISVLKNPAKS